MSKVTKLELEVHEEDDGYITINLTENSESKLYKMKYTTSIILSHLFAQMSYHILAKDTMETLDKMCEEFKNKTTVYDLFGALSIADDDEIKKITEDAIQAGIDLVKQTSVKDASDVWQECLLGGIASLLGPNRDASDTDYKYLMMLPTKDVKLKKDYVTYFENVLPNTRNYKPETLTAEDIEGYLVNILSLIIEQRIDEYSKVHKKVPDKKFFDAIHQHIIKITTEALSVIVSQIQDAYTESKLYNQLNALTPVNTEDESFLNQHLDFRDILRTYRDTINKVKKDKEKEEDEENN